MSTKNLSLFDLAPGKVLANRFELIKANRQGGMSTTFEAKDKESGEVGELQVVPSALFSDRDQGAEFADLMRKWQSVDSPHLPKVHEVQELEDGTTLILTALPFGTSLRDRLTDSGVMSSAGVHAVAMQLLDACVEIHRWNLVHGDIKPYTIHLEGEEADAKVCIVDGGVTPGLWSAKHLGDKTALIGTPFYAPVEQFGGDSPDVQSDVYNVATVLFEMATGVIPWVGSTFLEVFQAKLDKAPPSMRTRAPDVEVPPELEQAIVGGLMADRKQRYATADEFRARLKAVE